MDDAAVAFLARNAFEVFISLDGPARVHDRYRHTAGGRPTFNRVWERVKHIRKKYPDYFAAKVNFCMTLAPPGRISEITEFLVQNGDVFADKVPVVLTLDDAPPALYQALGAGDGENQVDLAALRERYLAQVRRGETPDGICRATNETAMARLARRTMSSPSPLTLPAGQCVPGVRCHVTPDGRLHACERVDTHLPIGNVDTGYDEPQIETILKRFSELVTAQCRDCWAVRLCRKCIVDIAEGKNLSGDRLAAICAGRRLDLERDLADYCRARSSSDSCFDSLTADRGSAYDPLDS